MVCLGNFELIDFQRFHTFPVGKQVPRGTRQYHNKTNDDDVLAKPLRRAPPATPASTKSLIGTEDQDLATLEDFLNPLLAQSMPLSNDRQLLLQAAYADGFDTCLIFIYMELFLKSNLIYPSKTNKKRLLPDCTSINLTISSAQETPELFAQGIADGWLPEASSCGAASRELLGNIPHEKNCSGYYPEDLWRFGAVLGGQFDVESFINLNWFSVVYLVCLLKGDLCCFYFNPQESYKVKAATYGFFSQRTSTTRTCISG